MMRAHRVLAAIAIALGADIVLALGYSVWCDAQMERFPPEHADAAVVFYSGGAVADMDHDRVDEAVALYRSNVAPRLYFVGGARSWGSGSELLLRAAGASSVPAAAMSRDDTSFDTQTNVASACLEMQSRGWGSLALVSDAMHIVRIRAMFARSPCANRTFVNAPTRARGPVYRVLRAHDEALAWAATLLPDAWREALLRRVRGVDPIRP